MAHEIETKILNIDKEAVIQTLVNLDAQKTQDTRLVVDWYRLAGEVEGKEPWFLRIRSNSDGAHEVTWKARSDILGTARKHKEINFFIKDPEKLADLFQEIGLEQYAHQEKDRISFTYKEWLFDIDTYPNTPSFIEVEGKSEEHVNEAIDLLGLGEHETWAHGERTLIQDKYRIDWYEMRF